MTFKIKCGAQAMRALELIFRQFAADPREVVYQLECGLTRWSRGSRT
jgi:hypothetical protein